MKGAENVAEDYLSRLENLHLEELRDDDIDDNFPDETLMNVSSTEEDKIPWFADFVNYLVGKILRKGLTYAQRCKRCVYGAETQKILDECHHGPTGGHYGPSTTTKKVFDVGFYWQTIFKEAHTLVQNYDACQRSGSLSRRDQMPQNSIQVNEIFDIWGINFMGPFTRSHKFEYILVAIDYVSKWAEAEALPTNDARVVIHFLKKLFSRFGIPKALINDRGTHFCNKQMEKFLKRYGVHHRFATAYHPQTSGQVENTNKALKRILEKTVKDNPSVWSRKLDDALWAFRTGYKTPMATTPYRLSQNHAMGRKKAFIYSVVENTCNEAKLYDLDETGKGIVKGNFLYVKKDPIFPMAQQIVPADQLVSKFQSIRRCNNYAMLQSIPCSPECKIVGLILLDHPLCYALTATTDVPAVYLQQFWLAHVTVSTRIPTPRYHTDFKLDSQKAYLYYC
ncbi:reverse transcriptase domain-containing protein [Tanacetum coccineum]